MKFLNRLDRMTKAELLAECRSFRELLTDIEYLQDAIEDSRDKIDTVEYRAKEVTRAKPR